jgi:hypothetical protein
MMAAGTFRLNNLIAITTAPDRLTAHRRGHADEPLVDKWRAFTGMCWKSMATT